MSIQISPDLQSFVQQAVVAGRFASESEVVDEALRLLRDRESRRMTWERLKAEIAEGIEASRRGDSLDEDEFFRQLEADNPGVFDDEDAASCP